MDRSELYELIEKLPDDQVPAATEDLRRRTHPRPARSTEPFAWFGMITDAPSDASSPERIDEMLAKGFGRD